MTILTIIITHGFTETSLKIKCVRIKTGIKKTVDTIVRINGFLILGFIDIINTPFYSFLYFTIHLSYLIIYFAFLFVSIIKKNKVFYITLK